MTDTNGKKGPGTDTGAGGRRIDFFVGVCPGGEVYLATAAVIRPGESTASLHMFGSLWPNASEAVRAVGSMLSDDIEGGLTEVDMTRVIEVKVTDDETVDAFEIRVRTHLVGFRVIIWEPPDEA